MSGPGVRIPFSPPLKIKIMTEQLKELVHTEQISEPEVMEVVLGYNKLVKLGILDQGDFTNLLYCLGIIEIEEGVFSINENETYHLS